MHSIEIIERYKTFWGPKDEVQQKARLDTLYKVINDIAPLAWHTGDWSRVKQIELEIEAIYQLMKRRRRE